MRSAVILMVLAASAWLAAERPTDKDIKELLERVHHERDRFEDQLDGTLKREILRGPQGEVDVARFLDDLQENVGRLKDRFNDDYAASAECTTVLQHGSLIQRFMAAKPPNFKGASEWNRLAASLRELANAYGTTFPLSDGATARRMNDREVQRATEAVADAVEEFKREVDAALIAANAPEAARRAALDQVAALRTAARRLASRLGDGRPASGEARALLEQARALQTASSTWPLTATAKSAWTSARVPLETVVQGFGLGAVAYR